MIRIAGTLFRIQIISEQIAGNVGRHVTPIESLSDTGQEAGWYRGKNFVPCMDISETEYLCGGFLMHPEMILLN